MSDPEATASSADRNAAQSFVWAFVSLAGNRLVIFITTIVLARLLVPEDFGVVAAALVVLSFINIVLDLGVGAAIVQRQERDIQSLFHTAFTLQMAAGALMTAIYLAFAPVLADMLGVPEDTAVFLGIAPVILVKAAGQTHDALLLRGLRFRRRTGIALTQALCRLVVSVTLAAAGAGVWALVFGMMTAELVATTLNMASTRIRPQLAIDRAVVRPLLKFGGAVTAARVVSTILSNTDFIVVGVAMGATALGVYSLAFRIPELLIDNVLITFSQVAFPYYSRRRLEGADLATVVVRSMQPVTLFGFASGATLAVIATDIVAVVLGEQWSAAAVPMALIAVALGIRSVGYASGDVYLAMGRPDVMLWISVFLLPPTVAGFVIAAQHGLVWIALVHVVGAAALSLIHFSVAARLLDMPVRRGLLAMRSGLGAVAGVLAFALPVRSVLDEGALRLGALVVASLLGAAIGAVAADRTTIATVRSLSASVLERSPR